MDDDPETELSRLRAFCSDIVALRRGDLSAGRLAIEQQRLAAEQATREAELEKLFWTWTDRADIRAKLYPQCGDEQLRQQVVGLLDRELFGVRHATAPTPQPDPDPATLI